MAFRFEWNPRKASANLKKHGVSFAEATTVFRDPLSITVSDPDHSESEARFVDLGMSYRGRLLVVSYTERDGEIRIISARQALSSEKREYEGETN